MDTAERLVREALELAKYDFQQHENCDHCERTQQWIGKAEAYLSTIESKESPPPAGMVMVPREPTRQLVSTLCQRHPSNLTPRSWEFARKQWAGLVEDALSARERKE